MFSDDATFYTSEYMHRHNDRIGQMKSFHTLLNMSITDQKSIFVVPLFKIILLAPFFFAERNVSEIIYLNMSAIYYSPNREWKLDFFSNIKHYFTFTLFFVISFVRNFLNVERIVQHTPVLTLMEFHLWVYVKQNVYNEWIQNIEHWKHSRNNGINNSRYCWSGVGRTI